MLSNKAVLKPDYAVVCLFDTIMGSVTLEWRNKFRMLSPVSLDSKEEESDYMATPHPAECFALLKTFYERTNSVTKGAMWGRLNQLKMRPGQAFDDFVYELRLQISELEGAREHVMESNKVRVLFQGVT